MKYFFIFLSLLIFNCLPILLLKKIRQQVGIDEIIVSAEFNENNPFNLPLSVSVLSTEDIKKRKRQSS